MLATNLEKFHMTVAAVLGLPQNKITDDLSSEMIDTWDSLNHINLVSALEQEFGVMLPTESLAGAQSIAGLKTLLGRHGVAF